jgi:dephospho-CoA kinase
MKIIAFTGMPCSGKTEAVQIVKDMEIPVIRMGDMVWEETKKQGFELDDQNVGTVANKMRKIHGKDIWAKKTVDKIKTLDSFSLLVIDGIRNMEEIEVFKEELGNNFILIAIEASTETRRKRALSRNRKDDSKNIKDLEERDKRELSWGLGVVIASADIVISNERNIDDLQEKIKDIFNKI